MKSMQSFGGIADAFVAKVDPKGSLVYSTLLGGIGLESYMGAYVAVDIERVVHVGGATNSTNFPLVTPLVPNPFQPALASPGKFDAWVVRIQ
jgi:hypothetical protein